MQGLTWFWQHRLWTISTIALLVVLGGAAIFWLLVLRSTSTPLNVRQALRIYRSEARAERREAQEGARGPGSAPTTSSGVRLPTPGVYEYRTHGSEQLSFGGISRSFPSATPLIVTEDRCVNERWEPIEEHVEVIDACPSSPGHNSDNADNHGSTSSAVSVKAFVTLEQIAGQSTTSTISCPDNTYLLPPGAFAGATWSSLCHLDQEPVKAIGTVVGSALPSVGGRHVPAWHVRLTLDLEGNERGTTPTNFWISKTNDVLLEEREIVQITQDAGPLGSVRYSEHMDISLLSLTPLR